MADAGAAALVRQARPALATASPNLQWSIYPDAGGVPAGNPHSSPAAAVWTHTRTATAPGVVIEGGRIGLDLVAAGQSVVLASGRYWMVINTSGTFANRWAWFASASGQGGFAGINVAGDGSGAWAINTAFASLDLQLDGEVPCGASRLGAVSPASGVMDAGGSQSLVATLLANGLAAGNYSGFACVASNDPAASKKAARVALTVTP